MTTYITLKRYFFKGCNVKIWHYLRPFFSNNSYLAEKVLFVWNKYFGKIVGYLNILLTLIMGGGGGEFSRYCGNPGGLAEYNIVN